MSIAVHMAKRVQPIDWTGVPQAYVGKCSAVCRSAQDCEDLVKHFGSPDFAPYLPVLLLIPGAPTVPLIAGQGYATAAELRDDAVVTWHRWTERGGHVFDFDALREKHGLMRRENFDAAVRDAMERRIARHKANPVTDPFRQPVRPNPTGKTVFGPKGD